MQLPARIGKYELEQFLGGGMSHVYRARDTLIGRTVAVKILTDAGLEDGEAKARFLAEARMAGNISHDNILSIYDFGEDEFHHPFMVMEYLRGEDLRHAIKNGRTGDLKGRLKIVLQVARALQYIHGQKIVHRDIKPENIHISSGGVVKLMDFGIAKTEGLSMTRTGYVLGTPYYMAPEQVTGKNITEQVDVYAFGVLLFEVLCGSKPISGDTVERIFYSILNEPLNLEPLAKAGVPPSICSLVADCTAKSPAARPQGFAPICAAIEDAIANLDASTALIPERQPAAAPPASDAGAVAPQPRPAWLVPGIAILAVAVLVVGFLVYRSRTAPAGSSTTRAAALAPTLATASGDMVLIPAGPFAFGPDKQPVQLPAFYIDRTEVSDAAYLKFSKATGHPLPPGFPRDQPDLPVVNVSIVDAHAFADWAGKRLPTAGEWEKAARGTDGRAYSWGNQNDPARANVGAGAARPVTDFANGASPYGVLNTIGNVWELVEPATPPSPVSIERFRGLLTPPPTAEEPWYMIRGGAFDVPLADGVIWDSTTVPARWKSRDIGFRCAKDAR